jgi:hypothetical protein
MAVEGLFKEARFTVLSHIIPIEVFSVHHDIYPMPKGLYKGKCAPQIEKPV